MDSTLRNRLFASTLLAMSTLPAHAADIELAGGKLSIKGSLTAGLAYRTVSRDTDLLADVNSSLVGVRGTSLTPTTGRNQDDGNLNFDKGDPVAQVINGYLSLEYASGAYGARASAKAWYDYTTAKGDHPWGNIPNGYRPDAALSDAGAQMRARFGGVVLDNLYVNGRHRMAGMPLEWSLGWQKLDWGNRYIVVGGLRDLNPIDIPALTRPGMLQRDQETRIPVPQIFARLGVRPPPPSKGSTSSISSATPPTSAAPSTPAWTGTPTAATPCWSAPSPTATRSLRAASSSAPTT